MDDDEFEDDYELEDSLDDELNDQNVLFSRKEDLSLFGIMSEDRATITLYEKAGYKALAPNTFLGNLRLLQGDMKLIQISLCTFESKTAIDAQPLSDQQLDQLIKRSIEQLADITMVAWEDHTR